MSHVECCSFFSINFWYISDPLPNVNISSTFSTHYSCVWSAFGVGKKTSSLRSAVYIGSLTVFVPCSGVLLLTLDRFLLRRTFWFLVLVWKKTCPKSLFKSQEQCRHPALIHLLLTLDRFSSSYLYVFLSLACSVIRLLLCTGVEGMTLCSGHICPLQFDSYVSTLFYRLFLSRMAVESFH